MIDYSLHFNRNIVDGVCTPSTWGLQNCNSLLSYKTGEGMNSLFNTILMMDEDLVQINCLDLRVLGSSVVHYLVESGCTQFVSASEYYFNNKTKNGVLTNIESKPANIYNYLRNQGLIDNGKEVLKNYSFFETCIGEQGQWYYINLYIGIKGKNYKEITFMDVSKIFVDSDFKDLKEKLLGEEYKEDLSELAMLKQNVEIISKSVKILRKEGLNKCTASACALDSFKKMLTKKWGKGAFNRLFPNLSEEEIEFAYSAYKGGICYVNPIYKSKEIVYNELYEEDGKALWNDIGDGNNLIGVVFDVNAMYTYVMKNKPLPFGKPFRITNEYTFNTLIESQYGEYDLGGFGIEETKNFCYIKRFRCCFQVKEDGIPFLQLRNADLHSKANRELKIELPANEQLTCSYIPVEMTMTDEDYVLFTQNYVVWNCSFEEAYIYECITGVFDEYVDKWHGMKVKGKKEGIKVKEKLGKIMDNGLSGKFGTKPTIKGKIPYIKDGKLEYKYTARVENKTVYMPVSAFITAYARKTLLGYIEKYRELFREEYKDGFKCKGEYIYDPFMYCDTDSMHVLIMQDFLEKLIKEKKLPIDEYELGSLKIENEIYRARYIRTKTYLLQTDSEGKLKVVCSGLSSTSHKGIDFDTFRDDYVFKGKKKVIVQGIGGMVEEYQDFKIRGV